MHNMPTHEQSSSATTKTNSNFTKIPSNKHFKAFRMSKFNSKTSFLYQLFKGNQKSYFYSHARLFFCLFFIFLSFFLYLSLHTYQQGDLFRYFFIIYVYINIFLYLQINISNLSQCLKSVLRQLCCVNSSRNIQFLQFLIHTNPRFTYFTR